MTVDAGEAMIAKAKKLGVKNIAIHKGIAFGPQSYEHSTCAEIGEAAKRLDNTSRQLHRAYRDRVTRQGRALEHLGQLLESYSYERVLERGFALVTTPAGKPIISAADLAPGDDVNIKLKDGVAAARVAGGAAAQKKPKPRKPDTGGDDPQGSLL